MVLPSGEKRVSALVSCLLPVLACLCRGFPGSGSLVLRPCTFGFLFVLVPPLVSFYWPRTSRSSSRREGHRVKRRGTDPRTGTGHRPKDRLLQASLYVQMKVVTRTCCLIVDNMFQFVKDPAAEIPPFVEMKAV